MEESREGDCRVPLISSVFLICLAAGGIFLVLYVFAPSLSQPWFPIAAFVMIGIPWFFWLVTYIYACSKACFRRGNLDQRAVSRRNFGGGAAASRNAASSSKNTMGRNASGVSTREINDSGGDQNDSPKDGKRVQFAEVVVISGENGGRGQESSSVASSKECEMPLNVGVSSS